MNYCLEIGYFTYVARVEFLIAPFSVKTLLEVCAVDTFLSVHRNTCTRTALACSLSAVH